MQLEQRPPTSDPAPATAVSPEEAATTKRRAVEAQIDAFLRSVGVANPAELTDEKGIRHIGLGSVGGLVGVAQDGETLYLRVMAPVMELPSDRDLILPLMRELLEINHALPGPARTTISGDTVFVAVSYPAASLRDEDVAFTIHSAMTIADDLDDRLKSRYGGTSKTRESESLGTPAHRN